MVRHLTSSLLLYFLFILCQIFDTLFSSLYGIVFIISGGNFRTLNSTLALKNKCSYNIIEVTDLHPLDKQKSTLSPNDKNALETVAKELLQTSSKELLLEKLSIYEIQQKNKTVAR